MKKISTVFGMLLVSFMCFTGPSVAGEPDMEKKPAPEPISPVSKFLGSGFSFSSDTALASKYIWRGQRATNDWSLQPSGSIGIGNFSFNLWGTMDLTAANSGDSLFLPEDPAAPSGSHSGLKGKFSEVNYVFSYAYSWDDVSIDVGTITYAFPDRAVSLPSTTEIYGGIGFDSVPLAPAATIYIDVDQSRDAGGSTGIYFTLAAGHSFPLTHAVFRSLDFSGWIAFANSGFGEFFYGASESGAHDLNFTVTLPMTLSEQWSLSPFVAYSALLGGFRDYQIRDPRRVLLGTAGSAATFADTIWGGITLSVAF